MTDEEYETVMRVLPRVVDIEWLGRCGR